MTTTITAYRERPITRPFMGPMRADDARRVGSMTKNEVIQRFRGRSARRQNTDRYQVSPVN